MKPPKRKRESLETADYCQKHGLFNCYICRVRVKVTKLERGK